MELLKSSGTIRCFNRWALLECDDEIGRMYRSLYSLEYFYKPKIQIPLWRSHISIIRGETLLSQEVKYELDSLSVEFNYIPEIKTNGTHFWLSVLCPILDDIRELFGLGASQVAYHLSIGNILSGEGYTVPEIF